MTLPLDPFSEVVDERRRWTPDWYGWLSDLNDSFIDLESRVTILENTVAGFRIPLTADRIFYISTSGSNSNDGTIGSPWQTIQFAYDLIVSLYDFRGHNVVIQLADGTYTRGLLIQQAWTGGGVITIRGNPTTPANVLFDITTAGPVGGDGGNCFYANINMPGVIQIVGMKLQTSVDFCACIANNARGFILFTEIDFGPTSPNSYHIACYAAGGFVQPASDYTISGGARIHYYSTGGWIQVSLRTIRLIGNPVPNFTVFAYSYSTSAKVDVLLDTFVDHNGNQRKSVTGTLTIGNAVITALPAGTAALLSDGMAITGVGVPANTTILSRNTGANTVTMSNVAGAPGGATALKFEIAKGQKYFVFVQAAINAQGAGVDYLPGDVVGSADAPTFSVYI